MIRKLSDQQLEVFDKEHIDESVRPAWRRCLAERFLPEDQFRMVDVGGGNGVLADAVLQSFPNAEAIVLDNSQLLLDRNREDRRKELLLASAEEIDSRLEDASVDLICFHWVLHHFVSGGYRGTTDMVCAILDAARRKLRLGGRVSIFENMYDGFIVDDLPGKLIYGLTSSRTLAKPIGWMGANTAGIGVCFRSQAAWSKLLVGCGYQAMAYDAGPYWPNTLAKQATLHLRSVRKGHFWLADANAHLAASSEAA